MSELPKNWCAVRLNEICGRIVDGSHNPPKGVNAGYPMLSARNVFDGQIVFDDFRWIDKASFESENARTQVSPGDVLLTIVGTIGRTAVVPTAAGPFALQRSVAVLKPAAVESRYLAYALESPKQQNWFLENAKGTAQKGVYLKALGEARIPLAPEAEQTRIVEKLDELLSDLDSGMAELKAAQRKLMLYRQSLLKAAVEGSLTADWRAANGKPRETGAELLQRILSERRARWEQKQLAKFAEQFKAPPKNWQEKYSEPATPDITELSPLPEKWVWASLDQLIAESSYGTSVKCRYERGGDPVLRIPNIGSGKVDLQDMKFATQSLTLEAEDYLAIGDVLIIRTNGSIGLVGRAAVVSASLPSPHYFASYLLRLRCVETTYSHRWINAALASPVGRRWIEARAASSAGQHNISLSTLLTMPVPLPPLDEQEQALSAVDAALEAADQHQRALEKSLAQSVAQRKNLLKAAFMGQLVLQDSNDEPASELIARIRAAHATKAGGATASKRGRKAKVTA